MDQHTFTIPNISCMHCVKSIKDELEEMDGVKTVEGSPDSKQIVVAWDPPATLEKIRETLTEINYPVD